jgi:hypothetical protein
MFGISGHGAKLEKPERPTALSLAKLPEEDWSRRGETNQQGYQHHKWEEQHQTYRCTDDVDQTLGGGPCGSHILAYPTPPHCLRRNRMGPDFSGY